MENKNILLKFVKFYDYKTYMRVFRRVLLTDPKNSEQLYTIEISTFEKILTGERDDVTYYKVDNVLHLLFAVDDNGTPKI